ncbi:hypothetical protein C3492_21365 [Streptomyces sp. Ru62]|uniref:hypothetical protein n=1 Tax=Streptomyces sp. Ru62 TaxID=2080745 RepID=UPI000CDD4F40|nr:hypothetical protein [Streptomyces sp. Ru62]POX61441.1 hypothetical protein C3492_21365 [Streptomyces sp. Ru62]
MIRRVGFGRVLAVTAAVLGGVLFPGVSVASGSSSANVRPLSAGSSHALREEGAGHEELLTIDRLERDGGDLLREGSRFDVRAGFKHKGERVLHKKAFSITVSERLSFATEYSNCEYGEEVPTSPVNRSFRTAVCWIDMRIEPGESVDLAPFALKVDRWANDETVSVADSGLGKHWAAPGVVWRDRHWGRGGKLTLAKRTGDVPPAARVKAGVDLSYYKLDVDVDSSWDIEVTGAALKGRKGETVTAHLAMDFHGSDVQAQHDAENSVPFARIRVQFPQGVTVLKSPKQCGNRVTKRPYYQCEYNLYTNSFDVPMLRDGYHEDFPFELRIDDTSELTGGSIRLDAPTEVLQADADHVNSTARITVDAVGGPDRTDRTAWTVAAGAGALAVTGLLAAALLRARRRAD